MKKLNLFLSCAAVIGLCACQSDDDGGGTISKVPMKKIELSTSESRAVTKGRTFAFGLLNEVVKDNLAAGQDKNVVISPLSASIDLSMIANGASGSTLDEILVALLGNDGLATLEGLNAANQKIIATLPSTDPSTKLTIANSFWVRPECSLTPGFVETNRTLFNATFDNVDFGSASGIGKINDWCHRATNGKISAIFDTPNADIEMAIVNALYFKGIWKEPFDKKNTRQGAFTTSSGSKMSVDMMNCQTGSYGKSDRFAYTSKLFGNGAFEMTFILANDELGAAKFTAVPTDSDLSDLFAATSRADVDFTLPRFEFDYSFNMNSALNKCGISRMFNSQTADFSNMCGSPLAVSSVFQKATIKVDEAGAEAAAVTGSDVVTSPDPANQRTLKLDRPFYFLITETSTGAILFMGRVASF